MAARHAQKVINAACDLIIGLLQIGMREAVPAVLQRLQANGIKIVGAEALQAQAQPQMQAQLQPQAQMQIQPEGGPQAQPAPGGASGTVQATSTAKGGPESGALPPAWRQAGRGSAAAGPRAAAGKDQAPASTAAAARDSR